jgi:putative DNA primase/helicase
MTSIPKELIERRRWVCWQIEYREGRPTKVPINPQTGARASSTDPQTWSDYATAVKARERLRLNGVGFVFSASDPYIGIDLDNCRNPETGEIAPKALKIVKLLNSFTEISPSGCGLHIFVRGKLPLGGNRRNGIGWWE